MTHHLTFPERELLYRSMKEGKSKAEIACLMGGDRSTIYRELRRNTGGRGYRPKQAQRLATTRRLACRRRYGDWKGDTIVGKGRRSALDWLARNPKLVRKRLWSPVNATR
jgi:IS30 family transposase